MHSGHVRRISSYRSFIFECVFMCYRAFQLHSRVIKCILAIQQQLTQICLLFKWARCTWNKMEVLLDSLLTAATAVVPTAVDSDTVMDCGWKYCNEMTVVLRHSQLGIFEHVLTVTVTYRLCSMIMKKTIIHSSRVCFILLLLLKEPASYLFCLVCPIKSMFESDQVVWNQFSDTAPITGKVLM